jgi:2Fe-2S ferredoxin
MATIHVTDIYGQSHTIEAEPGPQLMEILREYEWGVIASCGGLCSCATCHVHVDPAWIGKLPEMQADERELVSELATFRKETSRLSCQVEFTAELDGIRLIIAPEE